jgi:hypothetical protein
MISVAFNKRFRAAVGVKGGLRSTESSSSGTSTVAPSLLRIENYKFRIANLIALVIACGVISAPAQSQSAPLPSTIYANKLANAIYRAEGGAKARVPYGILAVRVSGAPEARQVCLRTIRHVWARWQQQGATARGEFIPFLAGIYCPAAAGPAGNRAWTRNVEFFMR